MSGEFPKECQLCTKTGMDAIACSVFPSVFEALIYFLPCSTAHKEKGPQTLTSGKVFGPVRSNSKPSVVNSSAGRTKATHPRIGY